MQNEQASEEWKSDVRRMVEMLENYPQIGHQHRYDHDGEIREVIVGRYRFIYRYSGDELEMRRVLHVRRDYNPMVIRDGLRPGWPVYAF